MTARRSHESRGIYRSRAETARIKHLVLEAWAAGQDGGDIAERAGITREYVDSIVQRARAGGDSRAALRYDPNQPRLMCVPSLNAARAIKLERIRAKRELIRSMARAKKPPKAIASELQVSTSTVRKALRA